MFGCGAQDATTPYRPPAVSPTAPDWRLGDWQELCRYDTARLPELSGLAPSVQHRRLLWAINDSGNAAVLYGLDARTCQIRAQVPVDRSLSDPEALASGRDADGQPVLWLADIGDNTASRAQVTVWEVPEPALTAAVATAVRHVVEYPGPPRDAETLMADPTGTRLWIVAKTDSGTLFEFPVQDTPARAVRVGAALPFATDGALSPEGSRFIVRGYGSAVRFVGLPPGSPLGEAPVPLQLQGEAIAFSAGGRWLYTTAEGDPVMHRAQVLDD